MSEREKKRPGDVKVTREFNIQDAEKEAEAARPQRGGDEVRPPRAGEAAKPARPEEAARAARPEQAPKPQRDESAPAAPASPSAGESARRLTPEEAAGKNVREDAPARVAREEAPARVAREDTPAKAGREDAPARAGREDVPERVGREETVMSARDEFTAAGGRETGKPTREQTPKRGEATVAADNRRFVEKFDQTTFEQKFARPVKSVVVTQDPAPGEFVPAGTPVSLSLTIKESLPLESFKDIDRTVADKYTTVGAMMADLTRADDATAREAHRVIADEGTRDYASLAPDQKQRVDAFMRSRFGFDPNASPERARKVFSDMKFMNDL